MWLVIQISNGILNSIHKEIFIFRAFIIIQMFFTFDHAYDWFGALAKMNMEYALHFILFD